jgi:hypothetical protein
MNARTIGRSVAKWSAVGVAVAAASYATYVGVTWSRYGVTTSAAGEDSDPLLDRFMPAYDVMERHRAVVRAPAEITFAAACEMDLQRSRIIRAVFKGREWIMQSAPDRDPQPRAFVPQMRAIGWGVLAEIPGREIVMGAVTQPWKADVVFRALPPEEFERFREPDHVKIAWTLRVDPMGATESTFRTETRAVATDSIARAKFRRYWSFLSPGIVLIRRTAVRLVKTDAERRAHIQPVQ